MSFYARCILPRLTDLAMRNAEARRQRAGWVPRAAGVVLEIGAGSGLSLPVYGPGVRRLYALEPSAPLLRMAARRAVALAVPVVFLQASAEAIPLGDGSVDSVVTTWTLCTIPDPLRALGEIRRVLRPAGALVFVEHGRAVEPAVVRWQDRLTPLWRRVAGGCHLNRPIEALLGRGGFAIAELESGHVKGPRVGSYLYRGVARPVRGEQLAGTTVARA